jgi:septal ring factor EnvC (AmiA/AmiB activator)
MAFKETQFDFTKESRKEPKKIDWAKFIIPSAYFVKKHKAWFMAGAGVFLAIQGITYIFSDSPEQVKTKVIELQTAAANIPAMINDIEKSKTTYDEIVSYLMSKEYDISTNSMQTMQSNANNFSNLNSNFKKFINSREETLQIINEKLKETKNFSLLTSDEKDFLLKEYIRLKSDDKYSSTELDQAINTATTIDKDDKVTDESKLKELKQEREEIKKEVAEIKKHSFKK